MEFPHGRQGTHDPTRDFHVPVLDLGRIHLDGQDLSPRSDPIKIGFIGEIGRGDSRDVGAMTAAGSNNGKQISLIEDRHREVE